VTTALVNPPVAAGRRLRIGVYTDLVYHRHGETLSADQAFIRYVTALAPHLEVCRLFGRVSPIQRIGAYPLPREGVELVPFPYYPRVTSLGALLRAARGTRRRFLAHIHDLDLVWVFGPNPISAILAASALRRGTPLVLGVRQDYCRYIASRLPSRRWAWALAPAAGLEAAYRMLARRCPTVVLGEELGERYRAARALLVTGFSLVGEDEIEPPERALARAWEGEIRLVTVGRVAPEKNPHLLLDVMARLRGGPAGDRWRLQVVGDGPMLPELRARARRLGLDGVVTFSGTVANGPALWDVYRCSHAFLHVSLTEGLPQVLVEAHAAGIPIVATAVGGVPAALERGRLGLLVPPRDAAAAAGALERLREDPGLRRRMVISGLQRARAEPLERQLGRVAAFLSDAAGAGGGRPQPARQRPAARRR
jgi:glycosyltransferase involved in cell wall biosynthesis